MERIRLGTRITYRRTVAAVLAVLMIFTSVDFSGGINAYAAENTTKKITAFAVLADNVKEQQVAIGTMEGDLNLPDTLTATVAKSISVAARETTIVKVSKSETEAASEAATEIISETATEAAGETTGEVAGETAGEANSEAVDETETAATSDTDTKVNSDTDAVATEEVTLTGITWCIDAENSVADTFDASEEMNGDYYTYVAKLPEKDTEGNTLTLADGVELPEIIVMVGTSDIAMLAAEPGVWNGTTDSNIHLEKSGVANSADNRYIIDSAEKLAYLVWEEGLSGNTTKKYYKLTKDLYLNSNSGNYKSWGTTPPANINNWKMKPDEMSILVMDFDGGGHTVYGMYVKVNESDEIPTGALFGYIKDGLVKNLNVKQSYSEGAGIMTNGECSDIANCSFDGQVVAKYIEYIGGICGVLDGGQITNCTNYGTITQTYNHDKRSAAGGIVGEMSGVNTAFHEEKLYAASVIACTNASTGTISGASYNGGIAGSSVSGNRYSMNNKILNCTNEGTIIEQNSSQLDTFAAGIVGDLLSTNKELTEVMYCMNMGQIEGSHVDEITPGGICTYCCGLEGGKNCHNTVKLYKKADFTNGVVLKQINTWNKPEASIICPSYVQGTTHPFLPAYDKDGIAIVEDNIYYEPPYIATTGNEIYISSRGQLLWYMSYLRGGVDYAIDTTLTLQEGGIEGFDMKTADVCLGSDIDLSNCDYDLKTGTPSRSLGGRFYSDAGMTIKNLKWPLITQLNGGTIENIKLVGDEMSISSGSAAGTFVCNMVNGTIRNCSSSVSIRSTSQDGDIGGLVGTGSGKIENCSYSGTVYGNANEGGFIGNIEGMTTITASFMSGSISSSSTGEKGSLIGYIPRNITVNIDNSYVISSLSSYPLGAGQSKVVVSDENIKTQVQFKSGEVCYLLNKCKTDSSQIVWGQTLGSDSIPMIDRNNAYPEEKNRGIVYYGYEKCNSTVKTYSNTEISDTNPDHDYEDGICKICKTPQAPSVSADVYQIENAGNLMWFAEYVNDTNNAANKSANAVLKANLSLTDSFTRIGTETAPYAGTFDGAGHTVTVTYNVTTQKAGGLFDFVSNATIKNLTVAGNITTSQKFTGGVVGYLPAKTDGMTTLENVISKVNITSRVSGDNTHGGMVGCSDGPVTFTNCGFTGTITAASGTNCGGLVGWANKPATFNNCYMAGTMTTSNNNSGSATFCRNNNANNVILNNCYYLTACGLAQGTQKKAVEFENGTVTYLLNGSTSVPNAGKTLGWYQNLDNDEDIDAYPIPDSSHGVVYKWGDTFKNTPIVGDLPKGAGTESDPYLITSANEMIWLADHVNNASNTNNQSACAKLTENIDLSKLTWTPIGRDTNPYHGIFDGNGHTVTLAIDNKLNCQGVFGVITGGVNIHDLTVDGFVSCAQYAGGIAGASSGSGTVTIERCMNKAQVTGTTSKETNAAGILGCNLRSAATINIINCANTGEIKGVSQSAAICGWLGGNAVVTNCWNSGTVTGNDSGKSFARYNSGTFTNCYYVDTSETDTIDGTSYATSEQFTSGEITYRLNDGKADGKQIWYQTIGTGLPAFSGDTVYYGYKDCGATEKTYNNLSEASTKPEHTDADNDKICDVCGASLAAVISVDITWGAMAFTYTDASQGTWNPNTCAYENATEASWSCDQDADKITVTSESDVDLSVAFSYEKAEGVTVNGSFTDGKNLITTPQSLSKGNEMPQTITAYLKIDGEPAETAKDSVTGTVTVTIGE